MRDFRNKSGNGTTKFFLVQFMSKLPFALTALLGQCGKEKIGNFENTKETLPSLVSCLGGYALAPNVRTI